MKILFVISILISFNKILLNISVTFIPKTNKKILFSSEQRWPRLGPADPVKTKPGIIVG